MVNDGGTGEFGPRGMNRVENSVHIMNLVVNLVHVIRGGRADLTFIWQCYFLVYGAFARSF